MNVPCTIEPECSCFHVFLLLFTEFIYQHKDTWTGIEGPTQTGISHHTIYTSNPFIESIQLVIHPSLSPSGLAAHCPRLIEYISKNIYLPGFDRHMINPWCMFSLNFPLLSEPIAFLSSRIRKLRCKVLEI